MPRYWSASAARAATASARTFDGPEPKRPSPGSRSAGIAISGVGVVIACHYRGRPEEERNPYAAPCHPTDRASHHANRGVPVTDRVSARVAAIAESATLAVDAKAKALKAAG